MPAKTSRKEAQQLAERCVADMSARLVEARLGSIAIGSGVHPFLPIIERHLVQRCADVIEAPRRETRLERAKDWARIQAYQARDFGRARDRWAAGASGLRVLCVPRNAGHLRDMESIASAPDLAPYFLLFDDASHLASPSVMVNAYARPSFAAVARLRAALTMSRPALAQPAVGVGADLWRELVAEVLREASTLVVPTLTTAQATLQAIEELRPAVVWLGNPTTADGAIAALAARACGLPSLAVQHGDIRPDSKEWARNQIDRLLVWGSYARDLLIELGLPPERIAVTGAPWADLLRSRRRRAERPRVLVALSGPGHAVGMSEHLTQVKRLVAASAELPHYEWLFRLHRKDDPEIYRSLMAEIPGAHGNVVEARAQRTTIHDDLETASALITVSSASAQDAMLVDVPVVTLGRPDGEPLPPYVVQGATIHAKLGEPLAPLIARAVEHAEPETRARARTFAERYFGPLDGEAAARVAAEIHALGARS